MTWRAAVAAGADEAPYLSWDGFRETTDQRVALLDEAIEADFAGDGGFAEPLANLVLWEWAFEEFVNELTDDTDVAADYAVGRQPVLGGEG